MVISDVLGHCNLVNWNDNIMVILAMVLVEEGGIMGIIMMIEGAITIITTTMVGIISMLTSLGKMIAIVAMNDGMWISHMAITPTAVTIIPPQVHSTTMIIMGGVIISQHNTTMNMGGINHLFTNRDMMLGNIINNKTP